MKHAEFINHFVQRPEGLREPPECYPFLTISEQVGAGGHALAQALAPELKDRVDTPLWDGWQVLDHHLCEQIASDPKLSVSMRELVRETCRSQIEEFIGELVANATPQLTVHHRMFEIMRTAASLGKVIIVGRAANMVTSAMPLGVHVRLVAPRPSRIERTTHYHHVTLQEAKSMVKKGDHDRAKLLKDYFSKDIEDPLLYHATFNTDLLGIEQIVPVVMTMIDQKASAQQT